MANVNKTVYFAAMQFLYPSFLYALGLCAIPVIIHLFNFRRYKKVVFSDIRFLKELTEQNKKQQTLKKYLILACRILAISFLVFAFAQPYIPLNKDASKFTTKIVSVYIDNSFSMQAIGKNGPLLMQAKAKAKQIAGVYEESDQFQLLTNDFEGRHQRLLNRNDFLQLLEDVQISPVHRNLSEVYKRALQLFVMNPQAQKNVYWISDFQKNMADYPNIKTDTTVNLRIVPLEVSASQNVWIDSVWLKEPFIKIGSTSTLQVLIRNQSETAIENQPLVLKVDGVQKGIQNYSCEPNAKTVLNMNLALKDSLWHQGEISLTDYPLVYDDVYHIALKARQHVNVLMLNQSSDDKAFRQVFSLDPFYRFSSQNVFQINFNDFQKSQLIILNEPEAISSGLNEELKRFIENGGIVLFIPAQNPKDLAGINTFLIEAGGLQLTGLHKQNLKIAGIDIQDQLFEKVFSKIPDMANLPNLNETWQIQLKGSAMAKPVMLLNNDWPYLVHSRLKKGSLYVSSASFKISNSNMVQHALFVPLLLRMPLLSKTTFSLSYVLGEQTKFNFDNEGNQKLIKLKSAEQEHLVEAFSRDGKWEAHLNGQLKTAGVYSLMDQNTLLASIAFNYNRKESYPQTEDPDALSKKLNAAELDKDLSFLKKKVNLEGNGTPFWRLALLLALVFVIIELILLKLLK
ncbi:MAG: BatA domain-containing protein [Bacteroidota bacterium]|nr:BatA domain-containing protein [Bacteroidota bacterium]